MPRPKKTDRPRRLEVSIPESILSRVQIELFSEVEGRVPFGALSELVAQQLAEWLRDRGIVL